MADPAPLSATPFVTRAATQPAHSLGPGSRFVFPLSGHDGHPGLFLEVSSRGGSAPLHSHPWPSWELVLDGQVRFLVDGQEHLLGAGDCMYTPAGVPHTYLVESETARLVGLNGAGNNFEELQRRAEPLFAGPGAPDMGAVVQLATSLGIQVLGPPLTAAPR